MDGKLIVYLIIGAIALLSRVLKKRAEQARRPQGNSTDDNRPIQPPTPRKDSDTFKDIFDRTQQQVENKRRRQSQRKPQPAPMVKSTPLVEYKSVQPTEQKIDKNYEDTSMQDMIKYEQPRDLQTTVAPASVNYDPDMINPILNNFDLRKAVIAQIILERPEF